MPTRLDQSTGTEAYRTWYNDWKGKRRSDNRAVVNAVKQDRGCKECGFKDFRALQFHHLGEKHKDIAIMLKDGCSLARIMEEMEKCDVLCANCHLIEHSYE